ncbi:unnamed protein product [Hermetia illucens]|uniref:Uncharacterized protein n=1 Tax=Hermetia illucens TaxID=343691 RepID=A0A7R8V621_HERIL|nr:unnamed protein product [Hermetia illucens]
MFGEGVRVMKHGVQHKMLKVKREKADKAHLKGEEEDLAHPPRRSSIPSVVEGDSGNTYGISDNEALTSRHTDLSTDAKHNLTCCILC